MKLREFTLNDYEELVDMFYNLNTEFYGSFRAIGAKYYYYKAVMRWIANNKHIVICEHNEEIVGFTLSYIDEYDGLTEKVYNGEIAYIKPKYRNTRAAYLLYNNVASVAKELNLNLSSNSRVENGVDKMIEKHFTTNKVFSNYERIK